MMVLPTLAPHDSLVTDMQQPGQSTLREGTPQKSDGHFLDKRLRALLYRKRSSLKSDGRLPTDGRDQLFGAQYLTKTHGKRVTDNPVV